MKRFLAYILIALSLAAPSYASSTNATSIQFLLSQVRNSAGALSGGKVYAYAAGTSTPKTIWLTRNKSTVAANPYTLDANGTAALFGDGLYRFVIKTSAGVTVYDRDNITVQELVGNGIANVLDYGGGTLAEAIAAIGSTPTTLAFGTDQTLSASTTIPLTLTLMPLNGAQINHSTYTISYLGDTSRFPDAQVFNGTGAISGLKFAKTIWFGAKPDYNGTTGTDSGPAFNRAFASLTNGGTAEIAQGRYYSTVQLVTAPVPTSIRGAINTGTTVTTLGTSITFAANVSGVKLYSENQFYGAGSQLENITLISLDNGNTASSAIGLDIQCAKAVTRNVVVKGFGSHGWRIDSAVNPHDGSGVVIPPYSDNFNLHRSDNCASQSNGGDGLHINGSNANAGIYTLFNSSANKGYQIYAQSSRNQFLGCHVDSSVTGAKAVYDNALANYYNIYIENYGDSRKDFELGTSSGMGVLEGLYYAIPNVTGSTTAMQSWRIYERYSFRQMIISDRNGGYLTGKQWKFLNGASVSGDLTVSSSEPDGTSAVTALRITADGSRFITSAAIEPTTTATKDLGTTIAKWRDAFFSRDGYFGRGIGVHGTTPPTSKPAVTGSRGSNAALASLISALASYGLILDSTSP